MSGRLRTEIIRFGLLLTMTVALISVATRYHDDGSGSPRAARGQHHTGTSASPSAAGSQSSPGSQTPSAQAPTQAASGHSGSHARSGGNSTAGGASGSGQSGSVATLPRTGGTQAIELAALAALFIAAGSFSVRISRPQTRARQRAGRLAALAQSGQAIVSSESNRPGTG